MLSKRINKMYIMMTTLNDHVYSFPESSYCCYFMRNDTKVEHPALTRINATIYAANLQLSIFD